MNQDYNLAYAYIEALTGYQPDSVTCDFRMIHDMNKAVPGVNLRGTLQQVWPSIMAYQAGGYGAFFVTQVSDGHGLELPNMVGMRAHFIDLDDPASAEQSFHMASSWQPLPAFCVASSPGKAHVYWPVQPYADQSRYTLVQRKLTTLFNSDKRIIDAARVMRLPGTLHLKGSPILVTVHAMAGYGTRPPVEALEAALAGVQIQDGSGSRVPLGSPDQAAPNAEWALFALKSIDPNSLDRGEWVTVLSAFKQAAWTHMSEAQIYDAFQEWCSQYSGNDVGENHKQFHSIRNTEVGWNNLSRRTPHIVATFKLGKPKGMDDYIPPLPPKPSPAPMPAPHNNSVPDMPKQQYGELLSSDEQKSYFNNCFFVIEHGEIFAPPHTLLNQTQFKGTYGGKMFVITENGKSTDDPWKAALQSTLWQIPKCNHLRFLPMKKTFEVVTNALGQTGVNSYFAANIKRRKGDPTPFLRHMELIMPNAEDRKIYLSYIAHAVKYPGYKIPWAPMLQSMEGAGKGIIKEVVKHAIGEPYIYFPKATELVSSGSKFNGWMREKLIIWVDEIKVDERRDLIEVLKPMISEVEIEVEAKGQDQKKEDNPANWLFFSNYPDAIPINENGRRYAIFYLAIQKMADLIARGMNDAYFDQLYSWVRNGGAEIMADWFLSYDIEMGALPMRAPFTSSTREALEHSRSPLDTLLRECVAEGKPGFRGGWVSILAYRREAKRASINVRSDAVLMKVLTEVGYHKVGKAPREYGQEEMGVKAMLFAAIDPADVEQFGRVQGYEQ